MKEKNPKCFVRIYVEGQADVQFDFNNSDDLKLAHLLIDKLIKVKIAPNYPVKIN